MNHEIENKQGSLKEIKITVSLDEMQGYLEKAAEEVAVKGFRPGKAPLKVVRETVGEEKIWHEAIHLAINQTYFQLIKDEKIEVISSPEVEILSDKVNEALVYKATVPVIPEISLPDYKEKAKKVTAKKKEVKIESKEIDEALSMIQKSRAKTVKVSRKSKTGDEVVVDFQAKIDGVPQEGLKGEKAPIILGDKRFIKGFEEELVDLEEGDEKSFTIKVPFSEGQEKDVEFDVKVISVNERELSELTDDFAKSLGEFSGIDDLKEKIGENIKEEKTRRENEVTRGKIMESIIEDLKIEIPEIMISREAENILAEFKSQFTQTRSFENYLKENNKTEEEMKRDWREQAEKRIKVSLLLREIADKEKIVATQEEVEQEVNHYLTHNKDLDRDRLTSYLQDLIRNNKVFKMLESL